MTKPYGAGTIVQSPAMHGVFGTVVGVRPQHRIGRGWGEVEYSLRNGAVTSWIDENQIQPATLDDIVDHYQTLMRRQVDRINALRRKLEAEGIDPDGDGDWFEVISDDHSNHGLPVGARVQWFDFVDGANLYTQGGTDDERAIDSRDLMKLDDDTTGGAE